METRTINQIKVYYLVMNPMTDRTESSRIAVMSENKERLVKYYVDNIIEVYDDGHYRKSFKKGSPLEWYNPIRLDGVLSPWGHGLKEEWIDEEEYINGIKSKYYFV